MKSFSKAVVTGTAGFIGSHLAERLVGDGVEVVGIDVLTDYYAPEKKKQNMQRLRDYAGFKFLELDLTTAELAARLEGTDVVFHLAGQPGVRTSWGTLFEGYVRNNFRATQRLLEAVKEQLPGKFVFASSSSIYGNSERESSAESDLPQPYSPYGVTKLASEHLVQAYRENYGVPGVILRFFTVFGPRQRPDMAFQRIIRSVIDKSEFQVFGDGSQVRDFTYVDDIVDGCVNAALKANPGSVYNLGGTNHASLKDAIQMVAEISGTPVPVRYFEAEKGDVRKTHADIRLATEAIGYHPVVSLREGLERQFAHESFVR